MNIRVLLLLGCLCAVSSQAQESRRELWTWTDANGVTHFSDRPVPGARQIAVSTTAPPPRAEAPQPSGATASGASEPAVVTYRSLEIWQPASGESFFGADAAVNVRLRSDPERAAGHSLLLYLDGRLVEGATNANSYTLTNLERGAHSLAAVITDERGNEKIRSEPRVFHVRQPTVNPPSAVGPNLRPPATPTPTVPGNRAPRG
jgi:hypothetical protein